MSSKVYQLKDPVTTIPGVGDKFQLKLKRLNISTIIDLLDHYPSRFLDLTTPTKVRGCPIKKIISLKLTLDPPKTFYSRTGKLITQTTGYDSSGDILLTWFNSPFIRNIIKPNQTCMVIGQVSFFAGKKSLISPQIESLSGQKIHSQGFVPIYPQTQGVSSKWLRSKIDLILKSTTISDSLSSSIIKKQNLLSLSQAYQQIHFPDKLETQQQADKRLAFDQHLNISIDNIKYQQSLPPSISISPSDKTHLQSLKKLPFKLTPDQKKAIQDLYQDLRSPQATHRLIQGDTGSGKTATLILTANQCLQQGYSFAILAPTQILAEQHTFTFKKLSLFPKQIQLVTAQSKIKTTNKPTIFIGTHALLNQLPNKLKHPVALIAIDEQHKFGVNQRQALIERNPSPHMVNLSATPIPRTIALGIFGEINISTIKHKPKNRQPVTTWLMDQNRLKKGYTWLKQQLEKNQKVFIVCPNIKKSSIADSIETLFPFYKEQFSSVATVLSLHGQMKPEEKTKTIERFNQTKKTILVSTSLIEVGIDIPDANIIIVHSAERFGLAQLHQLRGRVGRGEEASFCLIIPFKDDNTEKDRLQLLTKHHTGLKLARLDLQLRGAGELFGLKQHGHLKTRLKHFWDRSLYQQAKISAMEIISSSK